jgi:hypothetical protein
MIPFYFFLLFIYYLGFLIHPPPLQPPQFLGLRSPRGPKGLPIRIFGNLISSSLNLKFIFFLGFFGGFSLTVCVFIPVLGLYGGLSIDSAHVVDDSEVGGVTTGGVLSLDADGSGSRHGLPGVPQGAALNSW